MSEGFTDRVYEPDGSLRPRNFPGSMIRDPKEVDRHGLELATKGVTALVEGKNLNWGIQTICLHGDEPNAVENVRVLMSILKTIS